MVCLRRTLESQLLRQNSREPKRNQQAVIHRSRFPPHSLQRNTKRSPSTMQRVTTGLASEGAQDRRVKGRNYQRIADYQVSTTDPDATIMRSKGGVDLGYHTHYVVDGGRARIIVAALVTPSEEAIEFVKPLSRFTREEE
jgi:hypothetical protein